MSENKTAQTPAQDIASWAGCDRTTVHNSCDGRVSGQCMDFSVGNFTELLGQNVVLSQSIHTQTIDVLCTNGLALSIVLGHMMVGPLHAKRLHLKSSSGQGLKVMCDRNLQLLFSLLWIIPLGLEWIEYLRKWRELGLAWWPNGAVVEIMTSFFYLKIVVFWRKIGDSENYVYLLDVSTH